jgi:hypothetical protein
MIRIWHVATFALCLAAAVIALAPARLVLHSSSEGLSFENAEGAIWDAKLVKARIGHLDAGNVRIGVSFPDLFLGRVAADVKLDGQDIIGRLRVIAGLGGERRVTAPELDINGVQVGGLGRIQGQTRLRNLDIVLADQACRSAQGILESDILVSASELLQGNGPALSGVAECNGSTARLTLAGERDGDSVEALLDLAASGAGQWAVTYRTSKPEMAARLFAAGLTPQSETGAFGSRGAVKWLPM